MSNDPTVPNNSIVGGQPTPTPSTYFFLPFCERRYCRYDTSFTKGSAVRRRDVHAHKPRGTIGRAGGAKTGRLLLGQKAIVAIGGREQEEKLEEGEESLTSV